MDTFITDVSATSPNIAAASNRASLRSPFTGAESTGARLGSHSRFTTAALMLFRLRVSEAPLRSIAPDVAV
jgi:hypothetical protein